MKVKEDSDKTGLHFHLMTRKEILNCDIDNKDIDIVTDCFLLQFSHQFKCRLQQRHQEKAEAPKGRSGRISNDHQGQKHVIRDQSYTLIVPLTMNRCKSWKMKKVIKKEKWFIWNTVLEGSSIDTLDLQKDEQMVPEQIKPDTSLRQKWWNGSCPRWGTSWVGRVLWKKQYAEEKKKEGGKKRGTKCVTGWLHKRSHRLSLQVLSRAAEHRTCRHHSSMGSSGVRAAQWYVVTHTGDILPGSPYLCFSSNLMHDLMSFHVPAFSYDWVDIKVLVLKKI